MATGIFALMMVWLFRSPNIRIYYLLLSDKPLPPRLECRAHELATKDFGGEKLIAVIDWVVDKLEVAIMIGLIVVVIYA